MQINAASAQPMRVSPKPIQYTTKTAQKESARNLHFYYTMVIIKSARKKRQLPLSYRVSAADPPLSTRVGPQHLNFSVKIDSVRVCNFKLFKPVCDYQPRERQREMIDAPRLDQQQSRSFAYIVGRGRGKILVVLHKSDFFTR
jgi:hypothetical protein